MTRKVQTTALILILAVWIASFFVPAIRIDKPPIAGYIAAFLSSFMLFAAGRDLISGDFHDFPYVLYIGSFFLANGFMIAAPFALRILRRGNRGTTFLVLMAIWDALTFSWLGFIKIKTDMGSVLLGWWMWEGSLIAMTVLLALVRKSPMTEPQSQ